MNAEILTIGTEILLGEITDTNTGFLARSLASIGVNVFRTNSVGDNKKRIAEAIREILSRVDLIITTGGLGPTVDDPTREAAALALKRQVVFHPELWEAIKKYFADHGRTASENNKRQAYLPEGAAAIMNPVGTAPAFLIETEAGILISLPGVPFEMEYLMKNSVLPAIRSRVDVSGIIQARLLHTAGIGESVIDTKIAEFETYSNPTVGLAAHGGQVDIRLTARADSEEEAQNMLDSMEEKIRQRLGNIIYGVDAVTLEEAALQPFLETNQKISVIESGLNGLLAAKLSRFPEAYQAGIVYPPKGLADFKNEASTFSRQFEADAVFFAHLVSGKEHVLTLGFQTREQETIRERRFSSPPEIAAHRACNLALDFLRSN